MYETELTMAQLFDYERYRYKDNPHRFKDRKDEVIDSFLYKAKEYVIQIPRVNYISEAGQGTSYYENRSKVVFEHIRDRSRDDFPEDYRFEIGDKIFSYLDNSIVPPHNEHYPFFFFMKLSQYDKEVFGLKSFLSYQLESTYQKEPNKLKNLLEDILLSYSEDLPEKVIITTRKWILEMDRAKNLVLTPVITKTTPINAIKDIIAIPPATEEDMRVNKIGVDQEETKAYRTLAFYYIMKSMGVDFRQHGSYNLTDAAKMLHLLFNKEWTTAQKSEFNKALQKAPSCQGSPENNIKLLNRLKNNFQKMGLSQVVSEIEKDVEKENNAKKSKQVKK